MEFENYSRRINSIKEIEIFGQLTQEKQKQNRFLIKKDEMSLEKIEKSKFAQIIDKRYYFTDCIVSLLFSHPLLHEIVEFKRNKKQKIESFLQENINSSKWKNFPMRKTLGFHFIGAFYKKTPHFNILTR